MINLEKKINIVDRAEIFRFILNGIFATVIHYIVFSLNLNLFEMQSAGLANLIGASFGITCSFIGSRYFVFKKHKDSILNQVMRFLSLYIFIACIHGLTLLAWTDIYGLDYRIGFIIATFFQISLSYYGNKILVFKK